MICHSLGGLYGLSFAKLHPRKLKGVVLIDTTFPLEMTSPYLKLVTKVDRKALFESWIANGIDEQMAALEQQLSKPFRFPVVCHCNLTFENMNYTSYEMKISKMLTIAHTRSCVIVHYNTTHMLHQKHSEKIISSVNNLLRA